SSDWSSIPAGTLPAGEYAVIFNGSFTDEAAFRSDWQVPDSALVIALLEWGSLANSPSDTSEILELQDPFGNVVDTVNYDDTDDWPSADGRGSIALLSSAQDPVSNDNGLNWILSGTESIAPLGTIYSIDDIGSPGRPTPEVVSDGGFADWAASQSPAVGGADEDADFDGIVNLVEYALGLDPNSPDGSPGTLDGGTLSFSKGAEAVANGDIIWTIETSTDLGISDPWTANESASDSTSEISIDLSSAGAPATKFFARLAVELVSDSL
ncbi:MAG: hypothetical protein ACQKBU_05875, partial [Verrucomicrobiales bacterium]